MKSNDYKKFEKPMYLNAKIHINHFNEVSKSGVNAIRLYFYIRSIQSLMYPNQKSYNLPVFIDNKNLYEWFGVNSNKKWEVLNKLSKRGVIKLMKNGKGKIPTVRFLLD